MIQYCCDRCKRSMDAGDDLRYVVRIEIEAKFDVLGEEPDDDRDHLLELHEILERVDEDAGDHPPIDDDVRSEERRVGKGCRARWRRRREQNNRTDTHSTMRPLRL